MGERQVLLVAVRLERSDGWQQRCWSYREADRPGSLKDGVRAK